MLADQVRARNCASMRLFGVGILGLVAGEAQLQVLCMAARLGKAANYGNLDHTLVRIIPRESTDQHAWLHLALSDGERATSQNPQHLPNESSSIVPVGLFVQ